MVHDITIPLNPALAVWPGDTEFSFTSTDWGTISVGALTLSCHTGTHADAPRHFLPEGIGIAEISPEVYIGECVVLDATGLDELTPEVFGTAPLPPRVLLKTLAWTDHTRFPDEVPVLTEASVALLASKGVRLIGLDVPSVDRLQSKDLPIHHALAAAGIHILESLDLRQIAPGRYQLIALPLRVDGADGSPVRAVLVEH
ncbi:cyclase family protein [Armatimonas rosea]|uniref:Kynurenine formamidase n=1 Tax=Armatimonas rosea TaxID=685828 RepID=A0A7W9SRV5_ARMRO|nr:cyclase family protein [Armatimonas rosea]MBB6051702.1 arylformamidase [Armatimonas rosea]